jgi:hypothetical protein
MAVVIGVLVEDDKGVFGSPQEQVFSVFFRGGVVVAQEAFALVIDSLNVFNPPRCP